MGAMFKQLTQPKTLIFILAGIVVLSLLAWFAVRINRLQQTSRDTTKLVSFDYCGEELTKLCVVSFGRDADENTIINLFVPEQELPLFYLKVIRTGSENLYECDKNDEVKTIVYCTGGALNLEERFDIQIVSVKDDILLAQGNFTLTAFLIDGSTAGVQPLQTHTSRPATPTETFATPTTLSGSATPTVITTSTLVTSTPATSTPTTTIRVTPTATTPVSYPSYP